MFSFDENRPLSVHNETPVPINVDLRWRNEQNIQIILTESWN